MRVLVVEDDTMIGEALCIALGDAAWSADWVRQARAAASALAASEHDVVLLDLTLPDGDGLGLLREARKRGVTTPVVVLTARDSVDDRVGGLDAGADDYIAKPFDVAELMARLRAVLRRRAGPAEPILTNGVISLDPATHRASRGSARVILSPREFALLHALLARPGMIHSRQQLERSIYSWDDVIEGNSIDFLIHGVRRKLGHDAIRNVRGVGWTVGKGL